MIVYVQVEAPGELVLVCCGIVTYQVVMLCLGKSDLVAEMSIVWKFGFRGGLALDVRGRVQSL